MEKRLKPLGVILCGGESSRMGSDKSLLNYHGISQREHLKKMLRPLCSGVVFSIGNRDEPLEESFSDTNPFKGNGPVSGLLTIHHFFPHRDMLLVGCDYPLIRTADLLALLDFSVEEKGPVVFENPDTRQPEPLIGFYPAGFCRKVLAAWENGEHSLRRILQANNAATMPPQEPDCLMSADSPEEAERAREIIRSGIFTFV